MWSFQIWTILFENSDRDRWGLLDPRSCGCLGALPYLLAEAKVPVFGSELTIELAKLFVKGNDTVKKFNDFHVIDEDTEIDLEELWFPSSVRPTLFQKVWVLS